MILISHKFPIPRPIEENLDQSVLAIDVTIIIFS